MIDVFSWLITRKCNLKCSYCGISNPIKDTPKEYPNIYQDESPAEYFIECLKRAKAYNPEAFHIFYGGEPFLKHNFSQILNFANEENLNYTVITNNSNAIQKYIEDVWKKVGIIKGFTSSVDPIDPMTCTDLDRVAKSIQSMNRLITLKNEKPEVDIVAEIVVDNNCIDRLYDLVEELLENGIIPIVNTIDIAKTKYYDFSNVTDRSLLVQKTPKVKEIFDRINADFGDKIHMGVDLLDVLYNALPSNYDCKVHKVENLNHMTVDFDGSVRLCLRIRGVKTPSFKFTSYFTEHGHLLENFLLNNLTIDKTKYCHLCNWTCPMMSNLLTKVPKEKLLHT
jgi:MoaA/NifB/PqqE/SkfB family radical SAM enzyme